MVFHNKAELKDAVSSERNVGLVHRVSRVLALDDRTVTEHCPEEINRTPDAFHLRFRGLAAFGRSSSVDQAVVGREGLTQSSPSGRASSRNEAISTVLALDEAGAGEGQMGTDQPPLVGGKLVEKAQPG